MIIQDSPSATSCNLKILILIFHSMKIKMAKFLPSIISVSDNYATVGVSPEIHALSAEVLNLNFTVYVIGDLSNSLIFFYFIFDLLIMLKSNIF
jgi:hypothetical protein